MTVNQEAVWEAMARRFASLDAILPTDAYFVDDDDLQYHNGEDYVTVGREVLIPSRHTQGWSRYFEPGASWVHCNLLRTTAGLTVVSLRRGGRAPTSTGICSINVSVERQPLTIIDR